MRLNKLVIITHFIILSKYNDPWYLAQTNSDNLKSASGSLLSVQLKQLHGRKQSLTSFTTWMFTFTVTLSPCCHERHRPHTAAHTTVAAHALWFLNNVKITDTCPSPPSHRPNQAHAQCISALNACVNVKWVTFLIEESPVWSEAGQPAKACCYTVCPHPTFLNFPTFSHICFSSTHFKQNSVNKTCNPTFIGWYHAESWYTCSFCCLNFIQQFLKCFSFYLKANYYSPNIVEGKESCGKFWFLWSLVSF